MGSVKLTSRQKMINLMYLVFIAMLALQMGKQVLSSFGYLNEKLEDSNTYAANEINATLRNLDIKASEQPEKYKELNKKSIQISNLSKDFFDYLSKVKDTLLSSISEDKRKDYELMDSEDSGDEYLFRGENLTSSGEMFLNKINSYREEIVSILGSSVAPDLLDNLNRRFNTNDQMVEGVPVPWIRNRYEGFPLITTLTNISVIQSDIKTSEKEIYSYLIGRQLYEDASISANTYQAIVIPKKTAYFEGEQFEGEIVLGRYDRTLLPEKVTINGREVLERNKGAAVVRFRTGGVGENKIRGNFLFMQEEKPVEIPINSSYIVVPKPNSATISADKMNVVYRGIENPMTISISGISDNNIIARAPGLKKTIGVGKYTLSPGKGKEVEINVTGKTSDGASIKSPSVRFRIKDIPPPVASIRGNFGSIKMPKSSLSKSTVGAGLVDFDFDLKLSVSSFKIKVPGKSTVVVKGTRLDAAAKKALRAARRGDIVNIFDVKANIIGNSSYKLKRVLPLSIEIIN